MLNRPSLTFASRQVTIALYGSYSVMSRTQNLVSSLLFVLNFVLFRILKVIF